MSRRIFTEEWSLSYQRTEHDRVTNKHRQVYQAMHECDGTQFDFAVPLSFLEPTRWEVSYAFRESLKERRRPKFKQISVRRVEAI